MYARLHFYINFFLPVTKLEEKVRIGSKVKRVCDRLQTPYARVLASHQVSDEDKPELRKAYGYLDSIELRRSIDELQVHLLQSLIYHEKALHGLTPVTLSVTSTRGQYACRHG